MSEKQPQNRWSKLSPFILAGSALLLFLLLQGGALADMFAFLKRPQIQHFVTSEVTTGLFLALAASAAVLAAIRGLISREVSAIVLFVLCFVDLYIFGFNQNNGATDPRDYFGRGESVAARLRDEGKNELFRINSREGGYMILDRNQGMIDHVFLLEGYTPLAVERVWPPAKNADGQYDMLNIKYQIEVDEKRQAMGLRERTGYMPRAYFVEAARVLLNDTEVDKFMKSPQFDYRRMVALEKPPAFSVGDETNRQYVPARIVSYENEKIVITLSNQRTGILVLSEVFYPGWAAWVDGTEQEILRANGTLRGVALPPGDHKVIFAFVPASFRYGAWVSAGSLVLLGIVVGGLRLNTQRKTKAAASA